MTTTSSRPRSSALVGVEISPRTVTEKRALRLRFAAISAAVAAIVFMANMNEGAYFADAWGWVALAFWVATTLALILGSATRPRALRLAFPVLLSTYAGWVLLSASWSVTAAGSLREVERLLVYLGVAWAIALVLKAGDAGAVCWGAMVGTFGVAAYALATRLFPARLGPYDDLTAPGRLSAPLGYSNAVALLAVIGACLAVGLAVHARSAGARMAAAAVVPVFCTTAYFTYSRAAWPVLVIGLVTSLAVGPRRLTFVWTVISITASVAAAVWIASEASSDGDVVVFRGVAVAVWLVVACMAAAAITGLIVVIERRLGPASSRVRRAHVVVPALLVGASLIALVSATDVASVPSELRERFDAPLPPEDARDRLFSLSGNGRAEELSVAWHGARRHLLVGNGGGSYEYLWYELRESERIVRDAHSLYAEAFSEVGLLGLCLLLSALVIPIAAAVVGRQAPSVAPAIGAYVAWAIAAGLDWHWEMVGVTMTALCAGGAVLASASGRVPRQLHGPARAAALTASLVASMLAVVVLVGNLALSSAKQAAGRGDWRAAEVDAKHASALLFWSHEPELVRGDAAARLGDRRGAHDAYARAVDKDPQNWAAWLRLAQVAEGPERAAAYRRVHELNPRERHLPGE